MNLLWTSWPFRAPFLSAAYPVTLWLDIAMTSHCLSPMTVFRVSPHVDVERVVLQMLELEGGSAAYSGNLGTKSYVPAATQPCCPVQALYRADSIAALLLLLLLGLW